MRKTQAIVLALFLAAFVTAALALPAAAQTQNDGEPLQLESCVKRALEANPQMQAAKAQVLGAQEGTKASLAAMAPSAKATYYYKHLGVEPRKILTNGSTAKIGIQDFWYLDLNVNQPLFTGFKLLSTWQKAKLSKEQAQGILERTELTLIRNVQQAFLALLKARADVKSAQDSVAMLESQYKVTKAFYDVGLKPRLDVLQTEADLATAEQNLLVAQNNVDTQTAQLNTLLNFPIERKSNYVGELSYTPFSLTINQCIDQAYKTRPDLYIAQKSVEMARKDAKVALSPIYPQVSANFDYNREGDSPSVGGDAYTRSNPQSWWNWSFVVQAQWQVWDWGNTYFTYRQSMENVNKLEADYATTRLNATYEVKSDHLNIQNAAKRIVVAKKGLDYANEGYRMAVARYQAQVGTNTDVLDARSRVSSAENQLSQSLSDYQSALADIYFAMGIKNLSLTTN